jgi:hypothetical protein
MIAKKVIGTLALAFTQLSKTAFASLLQITANDLVAVLHVLHAVIHSGEGDEMLIYPLHASFHDFFTTQNRCTDPRFFIEIAQHHHMLACACIERMISLLWDRNTFGASQLTKTMSAPHAAQSLPSDLTYACRYWARHVALSTVDQSLINLLHKFTLRHLLYWIEALSLIDEIDLGISGLSSATKALSVSCSLLCSQIKVIHLNLLVCRQHTRIGWPSI